MVVDKFFESQKPITAIKVKIYEEYLKSYLPKILMTFGECLIVDLFCGAGINGESEGSPLILLKTMQYILSHELLADKNLNINIIFNDIDRENIDNLKDELKKRDITFEGNLKILNEDFKNAVDKYIIPLYRDKKNIRKFFFLDPFTYSHVNMDDLKNLMDLGNTEILLFIPVFSAYRFASVYFKKEHKTRRFVEEFTDDGIKDYEDVVEFVYSIKRKILKEINVNYVRPVLLDGGGTKNALFLLTNHFQGMLLINKIVLKMSENGSVVNPKNIHQPMLFGIDIQDKYRRFKKDFVEYIKDKGQITNWEVVDFSVRNEFLPRHAKGILVNLYKSGKIIVRDIQTGELLTPKKWRIAEDVKKDETLIIWSSEDEQE